MAEKSPRAFWRLQNPIMWACLVTLTFVCLILWFGLASTCNEILFPKGDCPPKWRHLLVAPPNEVGDTLAGLAGVLAFVWLIATVLLQATELREQREEFERMADAQSEQVKLLQKQAAVFAAELEDRQGERSRKLLNVQLKSLSDLLDLESRAGDLFGMNDAHNEKLFERRAAEDIDIHIFRNKDAVTDFYIRNEDLDLGGQSLLRGSIAPYLKIAGLTQQISNLWDALPEDQLARLSSIGFTDLHHAINRFVDDNIWSDDASDPMNPANFLERIG
ncbi:MULTISPECIES: hypothetical protein [unclassified Phaeobacter]|uniref:hypothetical protein n=1 Tax=unclassified Phaeobacter TaxID=2621772 RepID=UPI003A8BE1F5